MSDERDAPRIRGILLRLLLNPPAVRELAEVPDFSGVQRKLIGRSVVAKVAFTQ